MARAYEESDSVCCQSREKKDMGKIYGGKNREINYLPGKN